MIEYIAMERGQGYGGDKEIDAAFIGDHVEFRGILVNQALAITIIFRTASLRNNQQLRAGQCQVDR
ncbi:hypothetical protein SAMN03159341_12448 [Paenibacillus sp. 1_12]|uniref:hypothetical protein n=1 Tax=Paenibacillus sp. 1_12 TaxID=1566278 RepID=UPI0008E6756F|nr:hypothetical protein [Paenibacillus sp. 1_12]SFM28895.1 hypothetical protein SAMN03159341_12448 [Paenibacillus sp. 1_12]